MSPELEPRGPARWPEPFARRWFVAYLVLAIPILIHAGSKYWFFGDLWGLLAGRDWQQLDDLLRPQNGHWSSLPILGYAGLFEAFGLHSYRAYQLPLIAIHLGVAYAMRDVMRRAGVAPGWASLVAGSFVLLGSAHQNILSAIQLSMMLSVAAGFLQLRLATRGDALGWRDGLGLAAGLASLMASGVGPVTVVAVGVATLLSRGIPAAAFHTVPLATVYLLWSRAWSSSLDAQVQSRVALGSMLEWIAEGLLQSLLSFAGSPLVAVALAGVLLYGLVRIAPSLSERESRRRLAPVIGLAFAPLVLFAAISTQRWSQGSETIALQSRYLGLTAAFSLPVLAVAIDAVGRRHPRAWPLLVVLLVAGMPSHLPQLWQGGRPARFFEEQRALVLAAAYSPVASQVRAGVHPDPFQFGADELTVGWLLAARDAGKLPEPALGDDAAARAVLDARVAMRLSLSQDIAPLPDDLVCDKFSTTHDFPTQVGSQFGLREPVAIELRREGRALYPPLIYDSAWSGLLLRVEVSDVTVRVLRGRRAEGYSFCHAP